MVVLSIGTGNVETPYYYRQAKDWGLIEWAKPLLDILMSAVTETVDYQMHQIFKTVNAPKSQPRYLRIQADLSSHPADVREMDNADPANMNRLKEIGTETAQKFDKKLDQFVALLTAT